MATFPTLEPVTRRRSLGVYPVTTEPGGVRFLHGVVPSAQSLELVYESLTQAQAKLIRDHYRTQDGGFLAFTLPSIINAGNTLPIAGTEYLVLWKYAAQPEEQQKRGGYVDLTVSLVAVI